MTSALGSHTFSALAHLILMGTFFWRLSLFFAGFFFYRQILVLYVLGQIIVIGFGGNFQFDLRILILLKFLKLCQNLLRVLSILLLLLYT